VRVRIDVVAISVRDVRIRGRRASGRPSTRKRRRNEGERPSGASVAARARRERLDRRSARPGPPARACRRPLETEEGHDEDRLTWLDRGTAWSWERRLGGRTHPRGRPPVGCARSTDARPCCPRTTPRATAGCTARCSTSRREDPPAEERCGRSFDRTRRARRVMVTRIGRSRCTRTSPRRDRPARTSCVDRTARTSASGYGGRALRTGREDRAVEPIGI
jgi:hypothetical protein